MRKLALLALLTALLFSWKSEIDLPASAQSVASAPATWVHTTQADWMAGEREHLDVRALDAQGLLYGLDHDPRGLMRLASLPGPWSQHPANPLVEPGPGGAWDDAVVSEAKVIYDGQTYHMWYAGRRRGPEGYKTPMDLGYATSPDGIQWQKYETNPVFAHGPAGRYDENLVSAPFVLYDGDLFRLWHSASDFDGNWSINYATSTDGVYWTRYEKNPLLTETHDRRWDAAYIAEPCVLFDGSLFHMWYNGATAGTETLLGYATSPDGLQWTRFVEARPVLDVGPQDAWDDFAVARAHVLYDGERYEMWYEGHDGTTWRIGRASSTDGISWQRSPDNPILDLGPAGSWNSQVVSEPYVLFDGRTYWLWYSGYDGDLYRVGLATAPAVYVTSGTFVSPALEAPAAVEWGALTCDLSLPAGTTVQFELASSDDGATWSDWRLVAAEYASGTNRIDLTRMGLPRSRYLRYRATLGTSDPSVSPVIEQVTLTEAGPDFIMAVQPAGPSPAKASSLQPGQAVQLVVSLEPVRGFAGPVELGVTGLPAGLAARLDPASVSPPGSARLTVIADRGTQPGPVLLTIVARSGDLVHELALSLALVAPTPTPTATPTATATFTPTPTPSPTNTPIPVPTPLPPAQALPPAAPLVLWLGIGLAGSSVSGLVLWSGLRLWARQKRGQRRSWWRHWLWPLILLLLALVGAYTSWRYVEARRAAWRTYRTHIRPGVHVSDVTGSPTPARPPATPVPGQLLVAGIDASGMTADELHQAVEEQVIAPYQRAITVRCLDQTRTLLPADLDFRTNLDEIVAQAVAVGENEETGQEFSDFLLRNPEPFDVQLPMTYTFNFDLLVPWVEELAVEVAQAPTEHAFDPDTLTFTRGQPGIALDTAEAVHLLREVVPNPAVVEVELPVTYTLPHDWSDKEILATASQAAAGWNEPPVPASSQQITIPFDAERWLGPSTPASDWLPTRPMTGYAFLPGQLGWTLDITAARQTLRQALDSGAPSATARVFTDVLPASLTLSDVAPLMMDIAGHFDGFTGFYVQDLTTGEEIRHNTYVTASGMSMIKVAIMATAYRTITQPFDAPLQDAMSQMIAHSINEMSNYVILQIGEGDFQKGLERINETLSALGMYQTYISRGYRGGVTKFYDPIPIPERPPVQVPPEEQVDLWPDTAMQTTLSDQAILFEALYRGTFGTGRLLEAFPNLTPQDCQAMLDLLKTNPTRTFLGPGFADDVPMAHKNGFGGSTNTDERMNVGIIWPPGGRPYLVGIYQWDKTSWIHWLRVWPQQIEWSTTLYNYFTMPGPLPAKNKPK